MLAKLQSFLNSRKPDDLTNSYVSLLLENVINSQSYIWSPADSVRVCRSHDLVCQSDKKEKSTSRQRNWVEFISEAKLLDR